MSDQIVVNRMQIVAMAVDAMRDEAHDKKEDADSKGIIELTVRGNVKGKHIDVCGFKAKILRVNRHKQTGQVTYDVRLNAAAVLLQVDQEDIRIYRRAREQRTKRGEKIAVALIHYQQVLRPLVTQALADDGLRVVRSQLQQPGKIALFTAEQFEEARVRAMRDVGKPLEYEVEAIIQGVTH